MLTGPLCQTKGAGRQVDPADPEPQLESLTALTTPGNLPYTLNTMCTYLLVSLRRRTDRNTGFVCCVKKEGRKKKNELRAVDCLSVYTHLH